MQAGAREKVAAKRSYANYLLPYKSMNWSKPRTSLINMSSFSGPAAEAETPREREQQQSKLTDVFVFRRGVIPPYRQMFYQYCDIQVNICVPYPFLFLRIRIPQYTSNKIFKKLQSDLFILLKQPARSLVRNADYGNALSIAYPLPMMQLVRKEEIPVYSLKMMQMIPLVSNKQK